jgi:glycosyltransferase involved in cell wall biosynthesis
LAAECIHFRPDIIHAHTFHGFVAGMWASRILRRPLVYTVPSFFQHIRDSGYGWIPDLCARHHVRVGRFLTNYPSELAAIGVPAEKIVVFRGMADVAGLQALDRTRQEHRAPLRARLGIPEHSPVALSVGRLEPDKGYEHGLHAMALALDLLPDLHWIILGDGQSRRGLEAEAERLGIRLRVHFAGFVENPLPWYLAADAYLRPHVLEGDNLSSVQAMAAGLPVAGFATGSEAELVSVVGHGLLAPNYDAAALADALVRVIRPDVRLRLGSLGQAYAAEHFSSDRVIERCLLTYEELVGTHRAGTSPSPSKALW